MFRMLRLDIAEMPREQVTYRELLMQMTIRDLRLRYKQTVMDVGWAVFHAAAQHGSVLGDFHTRLAFRQRASNKAGRAKPSCDA
jgi:ABC-type polysaccharide/polyol phosphate export permease